MLGGVGGPSDSAFNPSNPEKWQRCKVEVEKIKKLTWAWWWLHSIGCPIDCATPICITSKGKMSSPRRSHIDIWRVCLIVVWKQEFKGTGLSHSGSWDIEVEDAAKVVRCYEREVGRRECNGGEFCRNRNNEGWR
jgi:hypothetical protein